MGDRVTFQLSGSVAVITLDDPPLNLFGAELMADLAKAVDAALASNCRAAVIAATGQTFSGGANVRIFQGRNADQAREMFATYLPVVHRIEAAPFPFVAAVQGLCLAAGLELALACDMIIAAQGARFSQVEALIGATTFLGGAQRLALRCGDARAREIVYTADVYDAATFERWNIVNRIVPDEILIQEALEFAERLAAGPTRAHAVTKKMLRAFCREGLAAADEVILTDSVMLFESEDMQSGVSRILEQGARNARYGKKTFKGA
ncbi:enoyl-CoA hydratase/isomerase family protein [Phenylobacterium sp.]|uniref:enoyl-CoA hydratase/isomerase family protein n=1 Tax=Phenylobacterium sp. TaxID=1871053 RepID=UPI0035B4170E